MDFPLRIDLWHEPIGHDIQCDAEEDKQQFQSCKLKGLMLVAKIGEGNGLESILGYCDKHHTHVPFMVGVVENGGDGVNKQQNHRSKRETDTSHHDEGCAVHTHLVALFLVHKAEEGGLHAKCQNHHQQSRLGIDIVIDTIVGTTLQSIGIEWHHQVVQESAYDT